MMRQQIERYGTDGAALPEVVVLKRTTIACPSQWEGRLAGGRSLYIRFRHDELSVRIGPVDGSVDDAIGAECAIEVDLHPLKWDGLIEIDEMLEYTGLRLSDELERQRGRL